MFAALNDSGSDDEAPQVHKKVTAPAPAAVAVAPKVDKKPERKPRAQVDSGRPPRAERDNTPYDGSDKVANPATEREHKGKGERKGKGDRGDPRERRERPTEGKGKGKGQSRGDSGREFPRHSATGRDRENPRAGGGKFNWGKEDGSDKLAVDGEVAAAEGAADEKAPVVAAEPIVEEEEEKTMSLDEYEKLRAAKASALNLNKVADRVVEADASAQVLDDSNKEQARDDFQLLFHDPKKPKQDFGRKKGRAGAKAADLVLNMKFVDENADAGKGERSSKGKGERRGKGDGRKGAAPAGKGQQREARSEHAPKQSIDLSNDTAFPTLGA